MTEGEKRMSHALEKAHWRIKEQYADIQKLREALLACKHEAGIPDHVYKILKAALAATEPTK